MFNNKLVDGFSKVKFSRKIMKKETHCSCFSTFSRGFSWFDQSRIQSIKPSLAGHFSHLYSLLHSRQVYGALRHSDGGLAWRDGREAGRENPGLRRRRGGFEVRLDRNDLLLLLLGLLLVLGEDPRGRLIVRGKTRLWADTRTIGFFLLCLLEIYNETKF